MLKIDVKKGLRTLLAGALLLAGGAAGAQDIPFSQFYANPVYMNPAFAGAAVAPRIALAYRSQWPSLVSPFTTVSASWDQYFDDLHGGVGAIIMTDRQGDHGAIITSKLAAMYSFRFQVSRDIFVSAALQAGVVNNALNWSEYLRFPEQISAELGVIYPNTVRPPDNTSNMSLDFDAGVLVNGPNWYGGLAVSHLTQPNQAFYSEDRVPMKITLHGGAMFNLAEEQRRQSSLGLGTPVISPNVVYQYQGGFHYFNYGVYLDWMPFLVGVWLRHGLENIDAFIFQVGVQQDYFKIGYSYDVTVSKLANATGGAHEITLGLMLPVPESKKKIKAIRCPSF
ncbi:MAG: PorP/SprF family type IX secretion system membrane protein [Bacteroidales bacterium]|nr:PorP/SprF family type IX secretion system membrane protein [Bacteroidales bacterium]